MLTVQGQQEGAVGVAASQTIWMPMEYDAQSQWRWLDWARFYFYRYVITIHGITVHGVQHMEKQRGEKKIPL